MEQTPSVTLEELYDAQYHLFEVGYQRWVNDVLFTFNWWFLVLLMILPIIIWWKLVDKSRLMEMLFVGLCIGSLATLMDVTGHTFSLWTYKYKIIQMIAPLIPIDFSLLPVSFMLIYQWLPKWKSYIVVLTLLAIFGTYVAEPLFSWLGIYHLNGWKYSYSLPIYIVMGIGIKALTHKLKQIQHLPSKGE